MKEKDLIEISNLKKEVETVFPNVAFMLVCKDDIHVYNPRYNVGGIIVKHNKKNYILYKHVSTNEKATWKGCVKNVLNDETVLNKKKEWFKLNNIDVI